MATLSINRTSSFVQASKSITFIANLAFALYLLHPMVFKYVHQLAAIYSYGPHDSITIVTYAKDE